MYTVNNVHVYITCTCTCVWILILVCAHLLPFVVCVSVLQGQRKHFKSGQAMKNVCERSEQIVFGTSEQCYSL